jgi:hypothetical protein
MAIRDKALLNSDDPATDTFDPSGFDFDLGREWFPDNTGSGTTASDRPDGLPPNDMISSPFDRVIDEPSVNVAGLSSDSIGNIPQVQATTLPPDRITDASPVGGDGLPASMFEGRLVSDVPEVPALLLRDAPVSAPSGGADQLAEPADPPTNPIASLPRSDVVSALPTSLPDSRPSGDPGQPTEPVGLPDRAGASLHLPADSLVQAIASLLMDRDAILPASTTSGAATDAGLRMNDVATHLSVDPVFDEARPEQTHDDASVQIMLAGSWHL